MSEPVIVVENLSKQYLIGENIHGRGARTFRDIFDYKMRRIFSRKERQRKKEETTIWALKDVSFEVGEGEAVGIIGRNGAGKSTLLKILSRITEPMMGRAILRGRVASLLEVGTGFNLELTGRENIYLNGSILGMRKKEIDKRFDEIVQFAGIEKFLDTPAKRYSSGMYVRLAFAVAAHLEAEILMVDEVLAVGDIQFQRKCMGKMKEVGRSGRTILFVSHNMEAISQLCRKSMLLQSGELLEFSDTQSVTSRYLSSNIVSGLTFVNSDPIDERKIVYIKSAQIVHNGNDSDQTDLGISVNIKYDFLRDADSVRIGIIVKNSFGIILWRNGDADSERRFFGKRTKGSYDAFVEIPTHLLKNGIYYVTIFSDIPMKEWLFYREDVLCFEHHDNATEKVAFVDNPTGILRMDLHWRVNKVE